MQPGDILNGKYQILASIGRGGMGEVYSAILVETGYNVAIKVVNRSPMADVLAARLEREAAAASRIKSPYVPEMYAVETSDAGELFLVMELLSGQTLAELLRQTGKPLPWGEVREIGEHVLTGLRDAHAVGVIHRDLKPANIFLEALPGTWGVPGAPGRGVRARVLDFGVCKVESLEGQAETLTVTGESVGTVAYMAPEQIRGASRVDARADLYSFGTVVFEALSGKLVYDAAGQMALLTSKLEQPARRLASATAGAIPQGLDELVARCLARDPDDRPKNAASLLESWRALGPPTEAAAASLAVPIMTGQGASDVTEPMLTAPAVRAARRGKNRALAIAGGLAVAVSAVLAFVVAHALRTRAVDSVEPAAPAEPAASGPPSETGAKPPPTDPIAAASEAPSAAASPPSAAPAISPPTPIVIAGPPRPLVRSAGTEHAAPSPRPRDRRRPAPIVDKPRY